MVYGACTNVKTTVITTKEEGKQPIKKTVTKACGCSRYYSSSVAIVEGGSTLCGSCGHCRALHK